MASSPSRVQRLLDWDEGVYHRMSQWFATRPLVGDGLLALLLAGLAVGGLLAADDSGGRRSADMIGVALAVGAHLPLAWRRQRPIPILIGIALCTWAFWILDYNTNFDGGILLAFYTAMAHERDRRRAWTACSGVFVTSLAIIAAGIISSEDDVGFGTLIAVSTLFGVAIVMGDNMRHRRAYQAELQARLAATEAEQAAESERAVAGERTRIARELHDVVAHSVSVMVVQAGAARRVLDTSPDKAAAALANIEATGRESLTEMRRVLGILRAEGDVADLAPQPKLAEFSELVNQCAEAGLAVELVIDGDQRDLGAGIELAAFRIVQEGLTNVLKHAGSAAKASVTLQYLPDHLAVSIVDDGRGAAGDPPPPGSGNGLVGMRERVDLYGGTLQTGPRAGGGYAVMAELPVVAVSDSAAT